MERSPFTPSRSPRSPGQIPFSTPNWLSSPSTLTSFERSKIFSLQENESLTLMELGTAARIIDDQCIIDDRNVPELGSAHMEYSSIPTTQQHPTFFLSQNESLELPEAILEQYNSN